MRSYDRITETRGVEGDPMVWPHPRDVIHCTPDQVTIIIICLLNAFFSDILSNYKTCFGL